MRRALLILVLASCAPEVHSFGGLTLDATASSFSVKSGDKVLLESVDAPVATRQGRATYEMQFGAWKITDNSGAWNEGSAFKWSDASHGAWSDGSKNEVASVEASSTGDGVVALKFTAANASANRFALSFKCEDADRFLGFGAQADAVDHHGHLVAMRNTPASP
jgi:predicted RecA/RadA family phage recombinase